MRDYLISLIGFMIITILTMLIVKNYVDNANKLVKQQAKLLEIKLDYVTADFRRKKNGSKN